MKIILAMAAILSGEAKLGFVLLPVALPHVKTGKVRAYAITSPQRFAAAREIPTMAEAGLPGSPNALPIAEAANHVGLPGRTETLLNCVMSPRLSMAGRA